MNIVFDIERLVLDEALLGGERAGTVRAALESALVQNLSEPGAANALSRIGAVVSLPACVMAGATHARGDLGGRIAAAVAQRLGVDGTGHPIGAHSVMGGRNG